MFKKMISFLLFSSLFGCAASSDVIEQAELLGSDIYTKEKWLSGSQEDRGRMLASFLRDNDAGLISLEILVQSLGSPTGYYDYDENLAYFVGPKSIRTEYGEGHLVVFMPDKVNGKVKKVVIHPKPTKKSVLN